MPTPIGHGLAGLAAGWAVAQPARDRRRLVAQVVIFAMLGAAADLDLAFGRHRAETHSVGAAAVAATLVAWRQWPVAGTRGRIWLAAFAAWLTHPLLDALAVDTAPPIGIMAFWPFSRAYVQTGWAVFDPIARALWTRGVIAQDLAASLREVAIILPIAALVWWSRRAIDRRQA